MYGFLLTFTITATSLFFFQENTYADSVDPDLQSDQGHSVCSNLHAKKFFIFSSPGRSPGRAIVQPLASSVMVTDLEILC